ncbi:MAG: electron transfer flavoprotein subunit alpha [Desulfovibrionales bacterium GWA2_65_9]|nr:MAG: electron transfer flavoprotein subunit alpha [Desulfovibrionales bacterium GWA2_65_9]
MNVLFLAHTEDSGSLGKAACEALGAAKGLGGDLTVGLYGAEVQAAADSIAACGAAKFYGVAGADFATARYGSDAAACEAIAKAANADVIVMPATARASRVAAGVAQRLGAAVDTRLTGLELAGGKVVATRWFYRQRMVGRVERDTKPWLVTVDTGCFEPVCAPGTASVELLSATVSTRTQVTGIKSPAADAQTIRPEAKMLLVAGAGWGKSQPDGMKHLDEASSLILGLLNATQCSLGSSKSLVDQSGDGGALPFLTHMHQVGQTGSTPRHQKGLATCCHGEEPHVVGWRFITERRAVNLDASCGWAQGKADVLYVADAFAVVHKVVELLK